MSARTLVAVSACGRFREAEQLFEAAVGKMDAADSRRRIGVEHARAAARKSNYHQCKEVGKVSSTDSRMGLGWEHRCLYAAVNATNPSITFVCMSMSDPPPIVPCPNAHKVSSATNTAQTISYNTVLLSRRLLSCSTYNLANDFNLEAHGRPTQWQMPCTPWSPVPQMMKNLSGHYHSPAGLRERSWATRDSGGNKDSKSKRRQSMRSGQRHSPMRRANWSIIAT